MNLFLVSLIQVDFALVNKGLIIISVFIKLGRHRKAHLFAVLLPYFLCHQKTFTVHITRCYRDILYAIKRARVISFNSFIRF